MAQYINKDALVAEIESLRRTSFTNFDEGVNATVQTLLETLDILEVKEVDVEKEIELTKGDYEQVDVAWNNDFDFIARHFFELGMQQSKNYNNNEEIQVD